MLFAFAFLLHSFCIPFAFLLHSFCIPFVFLIGGLRRTQRRGSRAPGKRQSHQDMRDIRLLKLVALGDEPVPFVKPARMRLRMEHDRVVAQPSRFGDQDFKERASNAAAPAMSGGQRIPISASTGTAEANARKKDSAKNRPQNR